MDLIDRQSLLRKLFPYEVVDKRNCVINAYAVEKAILDMPTREFNQEAIEYLEKVLEHWHEFCKWHPKFAEAIETLLEEVKNEHRFIGR